MMKILVILTLFVISLAEHESESHDKVVVTKELPSRLTRENFDRYFLDELTVYDLKHNFGIPYSFIAGEEHNSMAIREATFYTKYGKIKFVFESGAVKRYEVLAVDDSFISPME